MKSLHHGWIVSTGTVGGQIFSQLSLAMYNSHLLKSVWQTTDRHQVTDRWTAEMYIKLSFKLFAIFETLHWLVFIISDFKINHNNWDLE